MKTMKNIFRLMVMAALSAAVISGCSKREVLPGGGDIDVDGNAIGYLRVGDGLTVEFDGERINNSEQGTATRAEAKPNVDNFYIQILDAEGQPVEFSLNGSEKQSEVTFGQFKTALDGVIALPLGTYTMRAYSHRAANGGPQEVETKVYWEDDATPTQPSWLGESKPFTLTNDHITKDKAHEVVAFRCDLQTAKVTVVLEQALAEHLKDVTVTVQMNTTGSFVDDASSSVLNAEYTNKEPHNYGLGTFTVESGNNKLKNEDITTPPAVSYFAPLEVGKNSMFLQLDGDYMGDPSTPEVFEHINTKLTIVDASQDEGGVEAGQWRKIWLYLDTTDEETGRIVIGATIETQIYDKEVTVDATEAVVNFKEKAIKDYAPSKLSVESTGGLNLSGVNNVEISNGKVAGGLSGAMTMRLNTEKEVSKFKVSFSSENNSKFANEMKNNYYIDGPIDIASKDSQTIVRNQLATWGFPNFNLRAAGDIEFDITPFLEFLGDFGNHEYTISFDIESGNYYFKADLKLSVAVTSGGSQGGGDEDGDGPRIEWPGTDIKGDPYDFNTRYETDEEGLTVAIKIYADAGIKHLHVKMIGAIVDALNGDLPAEFDLAHTEDSTDFEGDLAESLGQLEFPVDEEVRGKTELTFDISTFLPLLFVAPGDSDFQLTVVDNNNEEVTRTIRLHDKGL